MTVRRQITRITSPARLLSSPAAPAGSAAPSSSCSSPRARRRVLRPRRGGRRARRRPAPRRCRLLGRRRVLEADVAASWPALRERYGSPTVLVSNAVVNANFDAVEMTEEEWDRFFGIDLKAAWLGAKPCSRTCSRPGAARSSTSPRCTAFVDARGLLPLRRREVGARSASRAASRSTTARTASASTASRPASSARGWCRRASTARDAARPSARWSPASLCGRIGEPAEVARRRALPRFLRRRAT